MRLQTTQEGRGSQLRSIWLIALSLTFTLSLVLGGPAPARANTPIVARAPLSEDAVPLQQSNVNLYLPSLTRYSDASYVSPFGISIYDVIDNSTGLARMQTAGADLIFTNARWIDLEPTEGAAYNFSFLDAKAAAAESVGMELVVLFDHNPNWALINTTYPRSPIKADKYTALVNVVSALAARYNGNNGHPRINYWLFYGEPDNIYSGWGNNGNEYGDMLALVSPAIKAVNSLAKVMPGAIAYERFTDDTVNAPGPFARSFLPTVLARLNTKAGGAAAYIDGVGFNEFGLSPTRWPTLRDKAASVRQIMAAANVSQLPLIVTELSRNSRGSSATETTQAQHVLKLYAQGIASNLAQLHWFMVFDDTSQPANLLDNYTYGLFRGTDINVPKPSYTAYLVAARELDGARFSRELGVSGSEGYVFIDGPENVTVVWATSSNVNVDFTQSCARVITRLDQVSQISDGTAGDRDGAANGRVRIQVTPNEPVIVRNCQ